MPSKQSEAVRRRWEASWLAMTQPDGDPLPANYCLEPSLYGGMLTQLASNGSTTFAAVNDFALPASPTGFTGSVASQVQALYNAVGEMVAVNQDTGAVIWDTPLPSSPYGAATVTNDVVFTTTFKGYLYAVDATTGAILFKTPMSAGSNAPAASTANTSSPEPAPPRCLARSGT